MPTLNKTIDLLNQLLVACEGGRLEYGDFSRECHNSDLRQLFASRALEWTVIRENLRDQIKAHGGRPALHPSLQSEVHRRWGGFRTLFGTGNDQALLDEGLRIEASVRQRFETVLREQLAPPLRHELTDQYHRLLDRQAQLRVLLAQWSRAQQR
ncbi:PA2169 family four-helix-bundle protein [Pseudomonas taiwanensis]|uniref:PA2169 family four-helix-bundle protein n=1 Tax=Pseudomonas taiwanensis TaxID=470150 RepID=UPI0015C0AFDC|nr:PA2169 family four-helix-bundle protein [Pseudomonas taiwanensis]